MRRSLFFLWVCTSLLFMLVQCNDTITSNNDLQKNLDSTSKAKNNPKSVTLISPENEATGVALLPKFEWQAVGEADSYILHVSHDDQMVIEQQVEGTSFTPSENLSEKTGYYWRVRAVKNGKKLDWSKIQSFTTKEVASEPLSAPGLISPANEAIDIALLPRFEWKAIEGADKYILHVSQDDQMVIKQEVDGTNFTPSKNLSEETSYYWRVRAVQNGTGGDWSGTNSFTTKKVASEPLPAPTLVSPNNDATGVVLQPGFEWKPVDGADSYTLHVSQGDQMVIEQQVEGTSFTPSKKLSEETSYHWRIRAVQNGTGGDWSGTNSFTTKKVASEPLPAPTLVSPNNDATGVVLQPGFEWKAVDGADSYTLHVSQGDQMVIEQQVEGTSFTPSEKLSAETNFYWRVRAVQNGTNGDWSGTNSFTTKAESTPVPPVTLISPTDGAGNQPTSVTFEWEAISNIAEYKIQLATDNSFNSVVVSKVAANTYYEISSLENSQTYYWRVQASGDGDSQNWSSVWSFTIEDQQTIDDGSSTANERDVLMELYNSTGGDYWSNNSGWGQGEPSDNWHGIQVNSQGQVTRIDLFNNNLEGQLPASIGDLKNVRYLNVKGNHLTGSIPQEIGGMVSLETLILSGRMYEVGGTLKEPPSDLNYGYHPGKYSSSTNRFSGTIPGSIGNLSNLEFLELSDQPGINGPIPSEIGNLSNLKGLYLNMLDLDGTEIPRSFKNLTELRQLYLSSSDVIGQLPDISNMTEMRWLVITSSETLGRGLTGELPDMRKLTKLRGLFLNNNELEGPYPSYFNNGNFVDLHTIGFSWNNLTGTLHGFNNLPRMESLTLSGNQMTGGLQMLDTLPERIQIISLGWNNFSGELPQTWPDFWQLKTLYLNDNDLSGAISCDFWNKIDNSRLGYAWLKNNELTSNCSSSMNAVEGNGDPSITVEGNNF